MARQGDQKKRDISVDSCDFSYVDLVSTITGWRVKATRKNVWTVVTFLMSILIPPSQDGASRRPKRTCGQL
jgi:hypothetical protein